MSMLIPPKMAQDGISSSYAQHTQARYVISSGISLVVLFPSFVSFIIVSNRKTVITSWAPKTLNWRKTPKPLKKFVCRKSFTTSPHVTHNDRKSPQRMTKEGKGGRAKRTFTGSSVTSIPKHPSSRKKSLTRTEQKSVSIFIKVHLMSSGGRAWLELLRN